MCCCRCRCRAIWRRSSSCKRAGSLLGNRLKKRSLASRASLEIREEKEEEDDDNDDDDEDDDDDIDEEPWTSLRMPAVISFSFCCLALNCVTKYGRTGGSFFMSTQNMASLSK